MKQPGHDNAVRAFRCILRNTELVTENVMWASLLERFDPNSSSEQSEISKVARSIFTSSDTTEPSRRRIF